MSYEQEKMVALEKKENKWGVEIRIGGVVVSNTDFSKGSDHVLFSIM